jgi:urease accessory protein
MTGAAARAAVIASSVAGAIAPSQAAAHLLDQATLERIGPFLAGVSHPVLGIDHFLAMFSVGLVSAIMGGRHYWLVPLCFVGMMPVGWMLGRLEVPFPPVEFGISLSVVLLGLAGVWANRLRPGVIYGAVAVFALHHGYAHGLETPFEADLLQYAAGFMIGTAGIHVLGLFAGDMLHRDGTANRATRSLSALITVAGCIYLFQAIEAMSAA